MIAGVINQTICTAHARLHKEIALLKYGVDCKKDLWKPYMASYLLQSISYSLCDEAYTITCAIDKWNKNLVTEKVCVNTATFATLTCTTVVSDITPTPPSCGATATIQQLN